MLLGARSIECSPRLVSFGNLPGCVERQVWGWAVWLSLPSTLRGFYLPSGHLCLLYATLLTHYCLFFLPWLAACPVLAPLMLANWERWHVCSVPFPPWLPSQAIAIPSGRGLGGCGEVISKSPFPFSPLPQVFCRHLRSPLWQDLSFVQASIPHGECFIFLPYQSWECYKPLALPLPFCWPTCSVPCPCPNITSHELTEFFSVSPAWVLSSSIVLVPSFRFSFLHIAQASQVVFLYHLPSFNLLYCSVQISHLNTDMSFLCLSHMLWKPQFPHFLRTFPFLLGFIL